MWCPSRGGGTRKTGGTVAESLVTLYIGWVRTRFGEGGGHLDRRQASGLLNTCARELKARTGRFLGGNLMSDHGLFLPTRANKERRTGKIRGAFFGDMHRALDD